MIALVLFAAACLAVNDEYLARKEIFDPMRPYLSNDDASRLSMVNSRLKDHIHAQYPLETALRKQIVRIEDNCPAVVLNYVLVELLGNEEEMTFAYNYLQDQTSCIDEIALLCKIDQQRQYLKGVLDIVMTVEEYELPNEVLKLGESCPMYLSASWEELREIIGKVGIDSSFWKNIIQLKLSIEKHPNFGDVPQLVNLKWFELQSSCLNELVVSVLKKLLPNSLDELKMASVEIERGQVSNLAEHVKSIDTLIISYCVADIDNIASFPDTIKHVRYQSSFGVLPENNVAVFHLVKKLYQLEKLFISFEFAFALLQENEETGFQLSGFQTVFPESLRELELYSIPYLIPNVFRNINRLEKLVICDYELRYGDLLPQSLKYLELKSLGADSGKWLGEVMKLNKLEWLILSSSMFHYHDTQAFLQQLPQSLKRLEFDRIDITDIPRNAIVPLFSSNNLEYLKFYFVFRVIQPQYLWLQFMAACVNLKTLDAQYPGTGDFTLFHSMIPLSVRKLILSPPQQNSPQLTNRIALIGIMALSKRERLEVVYQWIM